MDVRIKFIPKYRDIGICTILHTNLLQVKDINLIDFETDSENKEKKTDKIH